MAAFQAFRHGRVLPLAATLPAYAAVFVLPVFLAGAAFAARPVVAKRPAPNLRVEMRADTLTVTAEGAPLAQVMARLALVGGLQVQGPVPDSAISGRYGPGSPETVLADLLNTAHCSYVMSGHTREGLPHEVVLLASEDPAASAGKASAEEPPSSTLTYDDAPRTTAPGAIVHVPPNEAPEADTPEAAAQRSQQHLERLQQMERQRESQQPQP